VPHLAPKQGNILETGDMMWSIFNPGTRRMWY